MSDRRPLGVLIGGAPGSGKSTLANALGLGLDLPVLHKDQLVHGRWRTLGRASDLGASGIQPFFETMETWARAGISFVAEQTFYPGVSEPDVTRRLRPLSTLVHVHCQSVHSFGRWERRMRDDPLCGDARLTKLEPAIKRLNGELSSPLNFDCPTFVVNTDDGYQPGLEVLIAEIDALYSRPQIHELDKPSSSG